MDSPIFMRSPATSFLCRKRHICRDKKKIVVGGLEGSIRPTCPPFADLPACSLLFGVSFNPCDAWVVGTLTGLAHRTETLNPKN